MTRHSHAITIATRFSLPTDRFSAAEGYPMTPYTVHRLGSWYPALGITFGRHVFMRDPGDKLTLAHELVHVRQQAEHPVWFWLSYLFLLPIGWNPWRVRWEAEAYAVQARAGSTVESVAMVMAGPMYGWCCRRKTAEEAVRRFL